ncbi:MAG: rhamnulokinase [Alistipes sp.]|nr:rhamnulokinase [Candidatus Alistipes equi]
MKNYVAIDLGATSGRVIIFSIDNATVKQNEIHRFSTKQLVLNGHLHWDIDDIFQNIIFALCEISKMRIPIESIGIDTWGVDVMLLGKDGKPLVPPFAYRDRYTEGVPERFFQKAMSQSRLYSISGIQVMNFNTIFQLYAIKEDMPELYSRIDKILFVPDGIAWMLTGNLSTEYTIASTSALLDASTGKFSPEILSAIGLTLEAFPPLINPSESKGVICQELREKYSLPAWKVVAVASHDTASAVASVPALEDGFAYLSSGTWSLMGVEIEHPLCDVESERLNFTNEGGVNSTIRYLKNITGMWLLESCLKQWHALGREYSYDEIADMAYSSHNFSRFIDPDSPCFASPENMLDAIAEYLQRTSQMATMSDAEIISLIFESLALKYRYVFDRLSKKIGYRPCVLHVIGGGSQNKILNQYTASALQVPVHAGPKEATAIGNAFIQSMNQDASSLKDIRKQISQSVDIEIYVPQDMLLWNEAYEKFCKINSL